MTVRFRVNTPNVVAEAFDDEMVLVNLDNGSYYTLDKVGLDIWGQLEQRVGLDRIVYTVASTYDSDGADIEGAGSSFIEALQQEGLIVAAEHDEAPPAEPSRTVSPADRCPFTAPVLQRYTDMQDLLLLDPIHEVDESGWPRVKPDPAGQDV